MNNMINITPNGEIVFDPSDRLYKVNDEVYSEYICTTPYEFIARTVLQRYGEYLEQENDNVAV